MFTPGVPQHPACHQSLLLGLLLDAPASFHLHHALSRVVLHFQPALFPSRLLPILMAWRLVGSLGSSNPVLPCTPKLCPRYHGPVATLLPIIIGVGLWKKNMLLSWTTTLGISFLAQPRRMWSPANGFSNISSMLMAPWTDTRLDGYFAGLHNAPVLITTKPSALSSSQPLFAPSSLWLILGTGRSINLM